MNKIRSVILIGAVLSLAAVTTSLKASDTNSPPRIEAPNATLMGSIANFLSPNDTNGLMYANELNASFGYVHDSDNNLNGGDFKLDWWVTSQQGAFFDYQEFGDRSAYWSLGYQVRTVFKQAELSVGTGTRQNVEDQFGDVALFVSPAIGVRIINTPNWDVRIQGGADFIAGTSKPNPYVRFSFRFLKF